MFMLQYGISGKSVCVCECVHLVPEIMQQWMRSHVTGKVFAILCFSALSDDMKPDLWRQSQFRVVFCALHKCSHSYLIVFWKVWSL